MSLWNWEFYNNRKKSIPDGIFLKDYHKHWFGNYEKLSENNFFMPWLFPTLTQDVFAKPLSSAEIKLFKSNSQVQAHLKDSYRLLLDFFGLKLKDFHTGIVDRSPEWKSRYIYLTQNSSSQFQIKRIIQSLGLLGLSKFQTPLVRHLMLECKEGQLPNMGPTIRDHFIPLLKDKDRTELTNFFVEPYKMVSVLKPELRIVLLGKPGGGKSATGNSILGMKRFKAAMSASNSVTTDCQMAHGTIQGQNVAVIDTPGILNSENIKSVNELATPGPHVFIFVTQFGRFGEEDLNAFQHMKNIFGPGSVKYAILLFTHIDDLNGEPLEDFLKASDNTNFNKIVNEFDGRVCGFNNKAIETEKYKQRLQLIELITTLVDKNDNYYVQKPVSFSFSSFIPTNVSEFLGW